MAPRRLFLVRHGRPLVDPAAPPHTWPLDPRALGDVDTLAESARLPAEAVWFSSPEPKALGTARRLAGQTVSVVAELAEHRRGVHWFDDSDEFRSAVRRAFDEPEARAVPEWEPLEETRVRLVPAVRRILAGHTDQDVALVGHGTAWTLLVSELTGLPPDLDKWAALGMPDVWMVPRNVIRPDGPGPQNV